MQIRKGSKEVKCVGAMGSICSSNPIDLPHLSIEHALLSFKSAGAVSYAQSLLTDGLTGSDPPLFLIDRQYTGAFDTALWAGNRDESLDRTAMRPRSHRAIIAALFWVVRSWAAGRPARHQLSSFHGVLPRVRSGLWRGRMSTYAGIPSSGHLSSCLFDEPSPSILILRPPIRSLF